MNPLPSLFVSYGAPTFAIEPERAGAQLRALGQALGKPKAILVVSAHWMTRGVQITAAAHPETVHDFGGFPRSLYSIRYPAPGAPALASRVEEVLYSSGISATLEPQCGLDHGAWVRLLYLYPGKDVPVIQISIPFDTDAPKAVALGRTLALLVEDGVLIVGSGRLTHDLYEFRSGEFQEAAYGREFSLWIGEAVDIDRLTHALEQAPYGRRAHPTPEHFLPLLVAVGASSSAVPATVMDECIRHGVLAMESYVIGRQAAMQKEPVHA